jgi:hypothetical protein
LRFNIASGTSTVAAGATATVASGATLELAGSISALGAAGGNRVNVLNGSTAPGVLVSGTHQVVGKIDGTGTTQVNAGSDLTADQIVQAALVIGGSAGNRALVTIAASNSSGNPLGQSWSPSSGLVLSDSPSAGDPFDAGIGSANVIDGISSSGSSSPAISPSSSPAGAGSSSVPEPSSIVLNLLACVSLVGYTLVLRRYLLPSTSQWSAIARGRPNDSRPHSRPR